MQTNPASQVWQVVFHRVPEHIEIDFGIPLDDAVWHAGESSPWDPTDGSGLGGRQRFGRLADLGDDVLGCTDHLWVSVERCPPTSPDRSHYHSARMDAPAGMVDGGDRHKYRVDS